MQHFQMKRSEQICVALSWKQSYSHRYHPCLGLWALLALPEESIATSQLALIISFLHMPQQALRCTTVSEICTNNFRRRHGQTLWRLPPQVQGKSTCTTRPLVANAEAGHPLWENAFALAQLCSRVRAEYFKSHLSGCARKSMATHKGTPALVDGLLILWNVACLHSNLLPQSAIRSPRARDHPLALVIYDGTFHLKSWLGLP